MWPENEVARLINRHGHANGVPALLKVVSPGRTKIRADHDKMIFAATRPKARLEVGVDADTAVAILIPSISLGSRVIVRQIFPSGIDCAISRLAALAIW